MSFTQTFGGTTIYPSDVSYLALALTANATLEWPLERGTGGNLVASIIDITPTGAFDIVLPSAMLTGVGQTVLFNNLGPNTVTVKGSAGATLLSLAAGEVWQIYLTDNTTAAGAWRTFKYGASTAQAQASALAGYGLVAIGSVLAQASTISSTSITPQTLGAADRASTYLWTGGLGTFNLPSAIVVGNGWFFNVRNSGTGDLTLDPAGGELINGSVSIVLSPNDSAVIATDGTSWYTIGLGQQAIFAFDYTSISLAGLGNPSTTTDYVLSGTELNRIAYTFTGTPLGNINIVVPFTVQQYWMSNATGGSFILSLSTLGGTTAQIAQNARAIYYCTGSQIVKADTSTGLPIPVGVAQGGTGAVNANDALTNLGGTVVGKAVFTAASESAGRTAILAAASGVNSDITSLRAVTVYAREIHVSGADGNDTTGDGTLLNPVATITKALTLQTGTRLTIVLHPGVYTESPTVTTANTTIFATGLNGGNTEINGTLTLNASTRLSGPIVKNLVIGSTAIVYITSCSFLTSITKSGSGYVEIINSDMSTPFTGITISGAGTVSIVGGKCWFPTVANAAANVIIKDCYQVIQPNITAGNLAFDGCVINAASPTSNAVTSSVGSNITLSNTYVLNSAGTNVERVSLAGTYSIVSLIYDKTNSTFAGTNLNAITYFSVLNADTLVLTNPISAGLNAATTKTANYTAVAGDVLACNTITTGAFSITLPASPVAGQKPIIIFDSGTTDVVNGFATNNLTVLRNGSTINTLADDVVFSTKGVSVIFEYIAGTWRMRIG
jgi:hypothetical protein